MAFLKGQGAIELACEPTAGTRLGQGATEYLVLLAVVLIVALVSVALLGFFPGMASDAQRTQSETYWKSASPIAITEWAARMHPGNGLTYPYFMVRNSGAYPIRITGIVGADGSKATQFRSDSTTCGTPSAGLYNTTDYYYLAPGEEKYFGYNALYGFECDRNVYLAAASSGRQIGGATSYCANSTTDPGTLMLPSMGFEYVEYIDGQQITKRQIGKPVIIKCLPAS